MTSAIKSENEWVHIEIPTQIELKEHVDQERKAKIDRIYKDGIYPVVFAVVSSHCSLKLGLMCITTLGVAKGPLTNVANVCIKYLTG